MSGILWECFKLLGIWSSVMVIRGKNEVSSVLYLVLVYCNMAGLLILMEVEYLGMLLVIIYVGAVGVLFIFVIMMLVPRESTENKGGRLISVMWFGILWWCSKETVKLEERVTGDVELKGLLDGVRNVEGIGEVLFSENIVEVLGGGLILLVAIIGGIKLVKG